MNYLVKTKEGKFIVLSNIKKDWTRYIGTNIYISIGKETFKILQEVEIR